MKSSTFPRLLIPRTAFSTMLAQAAAEFPLECCGLLAGPDSDGPAWQVVRCYPLVNEAASPTEYVSEAHSILAADKLMQRPGDDATGPVVARLAARRPVEPGAADGRCAEHGRHDRSGRLLGACSPLTGAATVVPPWNSGSWARSR